MSKAGSDIPSTLMQFMLVRADDLDRPEAAAPAKTIEVFRTRKPIPGVKPGQYDLNLTLVTFPPHTPSNAPHHRTGTAALLHPLRDRREHRRRAGTGEGSRVHHV